MKKIISVLILLVLLLVVFEFGVNFFKKGHEVSYQVFYEDKVFEITEIYQKENGDTYDIRIVNDNNTFYYAIENEYNKQKKIIKQIEYFNDDNNICIYPILEDNEGTYIQCIKDGKLYTADSYTDQNFISTIKKNLEEKEYSTGKVIDINEIKKFGNSTIYTNNLIDKDIIALWEYKGIHVINSENIKAEVVLGFDKYENNHGILVDNYYVIPKYLNSKVLEFSSVYIVDVSNSKLETVDLGYTLSSNTYINGIVDNKLYYTDPSNLLQIEINPAKNNARLIGSKDIGGQLYDGNWKNANIYDFVNKKIEFKEEKEELSKYNYVKAVESNASYYFYNSNGEVYQVSKNYLDNPVLLFKASNINNFQVIGNTVYYIVSDTLYYFNYEDGIVPVLKNNDLRYNTTNRVNIYRKS